MIPNHTYDSPNKGGRRLETLGVVIHSTRGGASSPAQEWAGTINWFLKQASQVSAHRVVHVDGANAQLVADELVAWHARSYNQTWLGIEVVQPKSSHTFTESQYRTTARIIVDWAEKFGFTPDRDHIKGHDEIQAGKTDPGMMWSWPHFMQCVKEAMMPNVGGKFQTVHSLIKPLIGEAVAEAVNQDEFWSQLFERGMMQQDRAGGVHVYLEMK